MTTRSDKQRARVTAPRSMRDLELLADDNCNKCYGRGYKGVIELPEGGIDIDICRCVLRKIEKEIEEERAFREKQAEEEKGLSFKPILGPVI